MLPTAATPEDEAAWAAAVLFFEVDAAAGAVDVEAAPTLGGVDDEVESKMVVEGRFSSNFVVVVVPTAAASLAAASWWWLLFSREFISAVVIEPVPPVVPPTRVVPSLAGAAASLGEAAVVAAVVDSVPDALVRREAVEGL